jgi:uncharacterized protein (DUF1778 family)
MPNAMKKPIAPRKDESIRIRVTRAQKKKLAAAARRAGLGVSTWLLTLGLRAAENQPETP